MTNQEAFTKAAKHLLAQRQRALVVCMCAYRTPEGLKCAVGALIPDEEYDPKFEGHPVSHLISCIPSLKGVDAEILCGLQRVHDCIEPKDWPDALAGFADDFGLSMEGLCPSET